MKRKNKETRLLKFLSEATKSILIKLVYKVGTEVYFSLVILNTMSVFLNEILIDNNSCWSFIFLSSKNEAC